MQKSTAPQQAIGKGGEKIDWVAMEQAGALILTPAMRTSLARAIALYRADPDTPHSVAKTVATDFKKLRDALFAAHAATNALTQHAAFKSLTLLQSLSGVPFEEICEFGEILNRLNVAFLFWSVQANSGVRYKLDTKGRAPHAKIRVLLSAAIKIYGSARATKKVDKAALAFCEVVCKAAGARVQSQEAIRFKLRPVVKKPSKMRAH